MIQDPLNRQNQARISTFIKEAEIVYTSLDAQIAVAEGLEGTLFPENDAKNNANHKSAGTYHDITLGDPAVDFLRHRIIRNLIGNQNSIRELLERANYLLSEVIHHSSSRVP